MIPDRPVRRDSATYREVERLYRIAQSLRYTGIDRWNGDLYATNASTWGGLHPKSGALRLSEQRVLQHLTGSPSVINRGQQAQAVATVLHEATHGGMEIDAPAEPNAIRSNHSAGLMEGFAEVRTFADFELFADRAGYGGLTLDDPQYPGAFAAAASLMEHVTGPATSRVALIEEATHGPGVMHFDQFAKAAVANHLPGVVPNRPSDQLAVRAALIEAMLHAHWPTLPSTSAGTGGQVGKEIRAALDAKLDEIRRHYRYSPREVFDAGHPNQKAVRELGVSGLERGGAARVEVAANLRLLGGQPSAGFATRVRPVLGAGARTRPGTSYSAKTGPRNRDGRS